MPSLPPMVSNRRLLRRAGNRGAVANAAQALAEGAEQGRAVDGLLARLMDLHPLSGCVPARARRLLARAGRADFPMVTAATVTAPGHHVVSLYEEDDALVRSVVAFLLPAGTADDPMVVVATPAHRAALLTALAGAGARPEELVRAGRLVVLDAAETLARLMVHGRPDAERFAAEIGGVLTGVTATGGHARVYGEMVALLWEDGDAAGAVALEDLWNELAASRSFALCCGYPVDVFRADGNDGCSGAFEAMCGEHSALLVAPPV